ncbi:serpin family protein [Oceanobacillus sp. FSL K6-2867]|uniref:serpin family protein n=1 Tax=Oceanobacillus sp. FSL K6-2867 TaxID=2954748 RepID=UPI0030DB881A
MKKIIGYPMLLLGFVAAASSCGTTNGLDISSDVEYGESDYEQIITPNNELAFNLLGEVDSDEDGNLFISPTSLFMALSMIYNGAEGQTKEEIAKVLQAEGIDEQELNQANASHISLLHKHSEQIELNIANSIWLNNDYQFQGAFAENNKDYFNAELEEMDITDAKSPAKINNWVKQATNDKIEDIIEAPLDPNLVAVLINAIYFDGNWTYEFDEQQTENRPFNLPDGTKKDVPLMSLKENLAYLENEEFQAVSLPYGEDESMSMNVFLPKENTSLADFQSQLTNKNWNVWKSEFQKKEGTILLPTFQLEYEAVLNDTLNQLGMADAFNEEKANFSKMIETDDPLWISQIKQKTFIDVNEKGTEAAAATSVEMETTSAPVNEPFHMEVNRPFFIAITDDETGTILFMGLIANPQEGK